MVRKLAGLALAALVVAVLVPSSQARRPSNVHLATIAITRTVVNNVANKVTVTVRITNFFVAGGHWKLYWKKVGTAQRGAKVKAITSGKTGTTKMLAPGRWVLTVRLVNPSGVPYSPASLPMADLSDKRTVTVS